MPLSDDLKMLAQSAFADLGNSYQEILLQDSPLSVQAGPEWVPDTTPQVSAPDQGLTGEILSPLEGSPGGGVESPIIDADYRNLDDSALLPPAFQSLPAPDGPLLLAQESDIER